MRLVRINPEKGRLEVKGTNRNLFDLFDDFFDNNYFLSNSTARDWQPQVDIYEKDNNYVVKADIPGIDEKDLNVEIKDNVLTISGKQEEEKETKGTNYYRVERSSGSFSRSLTIPEGVQADKISADYKKGVLTVTLPRVKETEPKKIEVKAG